MSKRLDGMRLDRIWGLGFGFALRSDRCRIPGDDVGYRVLGLSFFNANLATNDIEQHKPFGVEWPSSQTKSTTEYYLP